MALSQFDICQTAGGKVFKGIREISLRSMAT